jgi:hypothetical protein
MQELSTLKDDFIAMFLATFLLTSYQPRFDNIFLVEFFFYEKFCMHAL